MLFFIFYPYKQTKSSILNAFYLLQQIFFCYKHHHLQLIIASQRQMQANSANKLLIKKDFFIKTRKDDIKELYEFRQKPLGRGAYGVVYLGRMVEPPNEYRVVKVISKKYVKNPEALQNEIQILRKLDHPNIVKLYEVFEDDKNLYLVQDYCEGGELFERLEQHGNFNQQDARVLFKQMVDMLKYLHSQKIAHRDLKPENFLMNSKTSMQIKLIDFGLSYQWEKDMNSELIAQKKNKLIGTSYYIAPEVLQLNYDQRCDIWSAGVLLYILATAAPPFDGEDDRQIMENVRKMQYSLTTEQTIGLSPQLKDLIRRILVVKENRPTLDEILAHPWMRAGKASTKPLAIDFKKLRAFSKFSKLKTLSVAFIASQIPQKQIHSLGQLFKQIDTNGDGFITVQELQQALANQHESTTIQQLKSIIESIDTDKNGKINYNEFVACCLQSSVMENEKYLKYVFQSFDKDRSGKISKKELKDILQEAGVTQISGKVIDELVESCDRNHDGEIDYNEFIETMRK